MNPTQFAENLLKALYKRFDAAAWLERLENVLYALEYGKQKPAEITWLEMRDVEESSRILLNPINACPPVIQMEKERLKKKAVEILGSLDLELSSGRAADGMAAPWLWPGPEGIFKECHIFAQWIIDAMKAQSETSAPPVVGESDEGIGQGPQDCEAGDEKTPDPKACTDESPDTVKHPDEGKPGYVTNPPDIDAYMPKNEAVNEATTLERKMTGDILDGMLKAQKPPIRWTRPLTQEKKPRMQRKLIHRGDWAEAMKLLGARGVDDEESDEEVKRRIAEVKRTKQP